MWPQFGWLTWSLWRIYSFKHVTNKEFVHFGICFMPKKNDFKRKEWLAHELNELRYLQCDIAVIDRIVKRRVI